MLPDRVSNPGPLTYESGALPIAYAARPSSCPWSVENSRTKFSHGPISCLDLKIFVLKSLSKKRLMCFNLIKVRDIDVLNTLFNYTNSCEQISLFQ